MGGFVGKAGGSFGFGGGEREEGLGGDGVGGCGHG